MSSETVLLVVARGVHCFILFCLLSGVAVGCRNYFTDLQDGRQFLPGLAFYLVALVLYLTLVRLARRVGARLKKQ